VQLFKISTKNYRNSIKFVFLQHHDNPNYNKIFKLLNLKTMKKKHFIIMTIVIFAFSAIDLQAQTALTEEQSLVEGILF